LKRATMLFAEAKENKMEIYNDILSAINLELINGEAKPTRVQMLSNLAYDKLVRYLNELEGKKMIITQERRTLIFHPYHHKQHHQHDNWCYMVCAKRKG
jgi:predicted transcriptional regulator